MSLGIVIKGPEGIVLAADSRVTLAPQMPDGTRVPVNFDNARKILNFQDHKYVGAVTYGLAGIGSRTAYSLLPEFETKLPSDRLPVKDFADRLSDFFKARWSAAPPPPQPPNIPPQNITFVVAGYNKGEPYGEVYLIEIPNTPTPVQHHPSPSFGITWGGQREIVDRLIRGYDERAITIIQRVLSLNPNQLPPLLGNLGQLALNIPIAFLSLQDCIDLAIFFVRTTIEAQRLSMGIRAVGGKIDVAIITRKEEGFTFIQQKELRGESSILEF